jgi:hypothetical protein
MECSGVTLAKSHLEGLKKNFTPGEIIEEGVARVLTNVDGHENPILFTWNDDIPNHKCASL